ncbi:MAG: LiaF transmembrane domain-containing protein [Syntrophothermus sp.]
MNEQTPITDNEPVTRREARRLRREQRLADPSREGAWIVGLILIILGGMFLLRNTGIWDIPFTNWWALFILIPAVGSLSSAWRMYRDAGDRLTAPARGSLLVGLVLTFVTITFLFDISWTYVGPILIIAVGIGIILLYMIGDRE